MIAKRTARQSNVLRLVVAADEIRHQPDPDPSKITFMARQLVQATLPHSNPGDVAEWSRSNGNLVLAIRPGFKTERKTGKRVCVGYPYGTIPRLLLFWITTEAVRTQERTLELGSSLNAFMRALGLDPATGGGRRSDARRLRDQMERLFRATISFERADQAGHEWLDMQVAPQGFLWWDERQPNQDTLFASWVRLSEDFFNAIISAPVPVDLRALTALKRSPLALDLYAWLSYRSFVATESGKTTHISWATLMHQLGTDYTSPDDFRRKAKAAIRKICAVYPGLDIASIRGGFAIRPGRPAIAARKHR